MPEKNSYKGFRSPKTRTNWFAMPNDWTDITAQMTLRSEILVVQYVLRHTWGYQEFDEMKRISLDEFVNGRKKRDGTRMDRGTSLSRPAVLRGIKKAIEHGFLEVHTDDSDPARTKKYYCLKMEEEDQSQYCDVTGPSNGTLLAQYCDVTGPSNGTLLRTKKDTIKKDTKERKIATRAPARGSSGSLSSPTSGLNGFIPIDDIPIKDPVRGHSDFHEECGRLFREALLKNKLSCKDGTFKSLCHGFRLLELQDNKSQEDIKKLIRWYGKNCTKKFCPQAYTSKQFREKWNQIWKAMLHNSYEDVDYRTEEVSDAESRRINEETKKKMGIIPY